MSPALPSLRIALCQSEGVPKDVAANLDLLAQFAQQAASQGADLLVLPELFLTGYNIGVAVWELAEPSDGPSLQAAAQIAQSQHIALLFGYAETDGSQVYNSAALVDARGHLAANYRKMHLYGPDERRLFQPGDQWVICPIAGVQVGILICYDVEFPEAVRRLAQQGAELIAVPTALSGPDALTPATEEIAHILVPARALENQVFLAYVNRCGSEADLTYCGLSCLAGPDGRVLERAGSDEALLFGEICPQTLAQSRSVFFYLEERRPDLYGLA